MHSYILDAWADSRLVMLSHPPSNGPTLINIANKNNMWWNQHEQTDSFPRDWNWEMPLYIPNQPTGRYHSTVTSFCSSYLQWTLTSCEKFNHSSATSSQQPLANMCAAVLNCKIEFLHETMQWEECFRIKKLSIFAHSSAVESLSFPISGWEPRTLAVQTLSMFSLLPVIKARVKVKSATGRGEQRAHVARNQPQPCSHETRRAPGHS